MPKIRSIVFRDDEVRSMKNGIKVRHRIPVVSRPRHASHAPLRDCGYMQGPWYREDGAVNGSLEWSFGSKGVGKNDPNNFYVEHTVKPAYGIPGDRVAVREVHAQHIDYRGYACIQYRADGECRRILADDGGEGDFSGLGARTRAARGTWPTWKPATRMPTWASRGSLVLTEIAIERLDDITETEAVLEGALAAMPNQVDARRAFMWLWSDRHGTGAWNENPWVWVLSFDPQF